VLCFKSEKDARRVHEVLRKRFEKYGLTLHPDKTKLVHFQGNSGGPKAEETGFKFLGFHYYMGTSRQGRPVPKVKTDAVRQAKSLKAIWEHCRDHRHEPLAKQHAALKAKVQGHVNHYAVSDNSLSLQSYLREVERHWLYWLNRRGAPNPLSWSAFRKMKSRWPWVTIRILHRLY
jgi:hypothetical protein